MEIRDLVALMVSLSLFPFEANDGEYESGSFNGMDSKTKLWSKEKENEFRKNQIHEKRHFCLSSLFQDLKSKQLQISNNLKKMPLMAVL